MYSSDLSVSDPGVIVKALRLYFKLRPCPWGRMELGLSVRWFGKRKEAKPDPMRFLIQAVCGIEPDLSDLHIQRGETVTPACLPACLPGGSEQLQQSLKKKKKKAFDAVTWSSESNLQRDIFSCLVQTGALVWTSFFFLNVVAGCLEMFCIYKLRVRPVQWWNVQTAGWERLKVIVFWFVWLYRTQI